MKPDSKKLIELGNSKLVFSPEFIPYYVAEAERHGFNHLQALLYGFLRFYLSSNPRAVFYFTNDQLAQILRSSESSIKRSVKKVLNCGEFEKEYKVRANGGTIRIVTMKSRGTKNDTSNVPKMIPEKYQKRPANNNKEKENKKNLQQVADFVDKSVDKSLKEILKKGYLTEEDLQYLYN